MQDYSAVLEDCENRNYLTIFSIGNVRTIYFNAK
jgi:hypothetical protein